MVFLQNGETVTFPADEALMLKDSDPHPLVLIFGIQCESGQTKDDTVLISKWDDIFMNRVPGNIVKLFYDIIYLAADILFT